MAGVDGESLRKILLKMIIIVMMLLPFVKIIDSHKQEHGSENEIEHKIRSVSSDKHKKDAEIMKNEGKIDLWPDKKAKINQPTRGYSEIIPPFEIPRLYDQVTQYGDYLDPTLVPNTFYYIWCGNRTVLFKQYLSILSVIRHMRPDNIVFYYDVYPEERDRVRTEEYHYNTWFEELRQNYPFLSTVQLPRSDLKFACRFKDRTPIEDYVLQVLSTHGGVYISENIMLTRPLNLNTKYNFRWDPVNNEGLLVAAPGVTKDLTMRDIIHNKKYNNEKCLNITLEYTYDRIGEEEYTQCIKIIGKEHHFDLWSLNGTIYPRDFWDREDSVGRAVRYVFYGSPDINLAKKNDEVVVPNIGHMVWVGGGEMDFLFYLSVLSMIYIQEVETLYIHGDLPPCGEYWERVKDHPTVVFKYRNFEGKDVYGNRVHGITLHIKWWNVAHWSDVIRVDILLKWGGIYIDTDAFFVQKLDDDKLKYDASSHYSMAARPPYPDSFVNGLLLARPGSEFYRFFQESMRDYQDGTWMYNGLLLPYKILERYPWLLRIEPHLQVVCLKGLCHPTWVDDFKNMDIHHLNSDSIKNWRKDAHVFHFCSNDTPGELQNETALFEYKGDSIFADMARFILAKAGQLPTKYEV